MTAQNFLATTRHSLREGKICTKSKTEDFAFPVSVEKEILRGEHAKKPLFKSFLVKKIRAGN